MYSPKSPYAPQVEQTKRTRQQQAGMGLMRSSGSSFGNGLANGMEFSQMLQDKRAADAAQAAKAKSAASAAGPAASAAMPQMAGAMKSSGMMGMSDERSKKEIARLESANDALTKALGGKVEYPDTNAPSSGLQALGQQDAPPSHADFSDTPAANKVAAQNVGMQQAGAAADQQFETNKADYMRASGMQPSPSQSNMTMSQNPAFNVSRGTPDLSALDEAYQRMGRGG
jgi:hypothetical protein